MSSFYGDNIFALNELKYKYKGKEIQIPEEIMDSIKKAQKVIFPMLDNLQKQKDYKELIRAAYAADKHMIQGNRKLDQKLYADWKEYTGVCDIKVEGDVIKTIIVDFGIAGTWVTQDLFYFNHKGLHLYDLTDPLFKQIKNDSAITSLTGYKSMHNGDDFWGWDLYFEIDV